MKNLFFLLLMCVAMGVQAETLPDNIYFRAMQDEMNRSKKELRVKGSAKPFYIAYRVRRPSPSQEIAADLGQLFPLQEENKFTGVGISVYIYAGDKQNNSSGYEDDYYARTVLAGRTGDSYESVRDALWQLTDLEYVKASNVAEKKEAYKRRKNVTQEPADFSRAPQGKYVEEIAALSPRAVAQYAPLLQALSNQTAAYPYLEQYQIAVRQGQTEEYFLDSEGDFYQLAIPTSQVTFQAKWHTKDGYSEGASVSFPLPSENEENFIRERAAQFLQQMQRSRQAVKGAPYLGPVLLMPQAAGGYLNQFFVRNVRHAKPLLSAVHDTDASSGRFRDKMGMRVISPIFDVFDRPLLRQYQGKPLLGFMPVDGEGVAAQELQLVSGGKLKALPSSRSLVPGQKQSNGHGRMGNQYPRPTVTNVFFEPTNPLPTDQLESELLTRCREQELEYCYIFHVFPGQAGADKLATAERIYTQDGHKEPVYGLEWTEVASGSLRDIWAAGAEKEVFNSVENGVPVSVVAPALLIDNVELMVTQKQPDQKPFLPLPN